MFLLYNEASLYNYLVVGDLSPPPTLVVNTSPSPPKKMNTPLYFSYLKTEIKYGSWKSTSDHSDLDGVLANSLDFLTTLLLVISATFPINGLSHIALIGRE